MVASDASLGLTDSIPADPAPQGRKNRQQKADRHTPAKNPSPGLPPTPAPTSASAPGTSRRQERSQRTTHSRRGNEAGPRTRPSKPPPLPGEGQQPPGD